MVRSSSLRSPHFLSPVTAPPIVVDRAPNSTKTSAGVAAAQSHVARLIGGARLRKLLERDAYGREPTWVEEADSLRGIEASLRRLGALAQKNKETAAALVYQSAAETIALEAATYEALAARQRGAVHPSSDDSEETALLSAVLSNAPYTTEIDGELRAPSQSSENETLPGFRPWGDLDWYETDPKLSLLDNEFGFGDWSLSQNRTGRTSQELSLVPERQTAPALLPSKLRLSEVGSGTRALEARADTIAPLLDLARNAGRGWALPPPPSKVTSLGGTATPQPEPPVPHLARPILAPLPDELLAA